MSERAGEVYSARKDDEVLMGAFGSPDTANTKATAFTDSATATTDLKEGKWYRFVATQDCHLRFAMLGDATTSDMFMKAGVPEVFYVSLITRVSAVQNSANGTLFATPLMTNPRETCWP